MGCLPPISRFLRRSEGLELGDDVGMLGCEIGLLTDFRIQIVEFTKDSHDTQNRSD